MFIRPLPLWPKHFIENQLIHFISQRLIRERVRIAHRSLIEPLRCYLGQFMQAARTEPLLAAKEQVSVFRTERIVDWRPQQPCRGGGVLPLSPWQKRGSLDHLRQQPHGEGRCPLTLPHGLDQLLVFEPLERPLQGPQREPTLRSQVLIPTLGERAAPGVGEAKQAEVEHLLRGREMGEHVIGQFTKCT